MIEAVRLYLDKLRGTWSWTIEFAGGGALGGHGFDDRKVALADLLATLRDQERQGVR